MEHIKYYASIEDADNCELEYPSLCYVEGIGIYYAGKDRDYVLLEKSSDGIYADDFCDIMEEINGTDSGVEESGVVDDYIGLVDEING